MPNRIALDALVSQALGETYSSAPIEQRSQILNELEGDPEKTRSLLIQLDPVFAAKTKEEQDKDLFQLVNETSWAGTLAAAPVGAAGGIIKGAGGIVETAGQLIGGETGGAPGRAVAGLGQSMVEWAQPEAPADSWKSTVSSGVTSAAQTSATAAGAIATGLNPTTAIPIGLGFVAAGSKAHDVMAEQPPGTDPRLAAAKGALMGGVVGTAEAVGERLLGAVPLFNRLEEASKALGVMDGGKALMKSLAMSLPGEMTEETGQAVLETALDRTMGSGKWGPRVPEHLRPAFMDELRSNVKEAILTTPISVLAQGAIHRSVRSVVGGQPLPSDLGDQPGGELPSPNQPADALSIPADAPDDPDAIMDLTGDVELEAEIDRQQRETLGILNVLPDPKVPAGAAQMPEDPNYLNQLTSLAQKAADGDEAANQIFEALPDVQKDTALRLLVDQGRDATSLASAPPTATVVERDGTVLSMGGTGRVEMAMKLPQFKRTDVGATSGKPTPAQQPMPIEQLQSTVKTLAQGWSKDAPEIVTVQSTADLAQQGIKVQTGKEVAGVHLNGIVYLVANNLSTPTDVERTVLHETAAHYGFERMAGAELTPILAQVLHAARSDPAMKQLLQQVRELYPEYGQRETAKELLGAMAETLARPGLRGSMERLAQRIENAVRKFIRALGFRLVLNRADIMAMLQLSMKRATSGQIKPGPKTAPAQFMFMGKRATDFSAAQTGGKSFKGLDNEDRFRISDKDTTLNSSALLPVGRTKIRRYKGPLGGLLGHISLFRNYPTLANVPVDVSVGGTSKSRTLGYAVPGPLNEHAREIVIHPGMTEAEVLNVLIHEIQHSIQGYENLNAGVSTRKNLVRMVSSDPEMSQLEQQLAGMAMDDPAAAPLLEQRAARFAKLYDDWENYGRLGGEIEARDAAATAGLDQAALDQTTPYRSQTEINLDNTAPQIEFMGLKGKMLSLSVSQRNKKLKGMTLNKLPVRVVEDQGAQSVVVHERSGKKFLVDNSDLTFDPNLEKLASDDQAFDGGAANFFGLMKLMKLLQREILKADPSNLPGHKWYDALKLMTNSQLPTFSITKEGPKVRMTWDLIARYPAAATRIFAANLGEFVDYLDSSLPLNSEVRKEGNILGHLLGLWRYGLQTAGAMPFEGISPQNRALLDQVMEDVNKEVERVQSGPNPIPADKLDKFMRSEYQKRFEALVKTIEPKIDQKTRSQVYSYASKVARRAMLGSQAYKAKRMPKGWLQDPAKRAEYVRIRQQVYYKELQRVIGGTSQDNLLYAPALNAELMNLQSAVYGGEKARMRGTRGLYSAFLGAYLTQPMLTVDGRVVNAIDHFAPTFKAGFESYAARHPQFTEALKEMRRFLNSPSAQFAEYKEAMRQADAKEVMKKAAKDDPEQNQSMWLTLRRYMLNRQAAIYDAIAQLPRNIQVRVQNAIEKAAGNMSATQVLVEAYDRLLSKHFGNRTDLYENLGPYLGLMRIAEGERTKTLHSVYKRYEKDPVTGRRIVIEEQADEQVNLLNVRGIQSPEEARAMLKTMFQEPAMVGQEARFKAFLDEMTTMRQNKLIPDMEQSNVFNKFWLAKVKASKAYSSNMVVDYLHNAGASSSTVKSYREQFGSTKDIINPLAATMFMDMSLIHTVRVETMKKVTIDALRQADPTLVREAKKDPNGRFMEPRDPKRKLVEYMQEGVVRGYELPFAIADGFSAPDRASVPLLANINRWYRKIFTNYNLPFVLKNPFRDLVSAVTNLRGGKNWSLKPTAELTFLKDWVSAAWEVVRGRVPEAEREKLLREAIAYSTMDTMNSDDQDTLAQRMFSMFNMDNQVVREANAKLREQTASAATNLLGQIWGNTLGRYFKFVERMAAGSEVITKLATRRFYERDYGQFMTQEEIDLRVRNEVGTPNGLTQGIYNKHMKCLSIFANMFLRGNARDIHVATGAGEGWQAGARVAAKRLTLVTAVQFFYMGVISGAYRAMFDIPDEEDELAWALRCIDHRDRARNVCIPFAIVEQDQVKPLGQGTPGELGGFAGKVLYMRIPLDQTSQVLSETLFQVLNSGDALSAFTNTASAINQDIPGTSPLLETLKMARDLISGKNPTDSSGFPLIPQESFVAGGSVMNRDVARAAWNWSGAGPALWRLKPGSELEIKTQFEQMIDMPIAERLWSSVFKISNKGLADEVRTMSEKQKAEIDNLRANIKRAMKDPSGGALDTLLANPDQLTEEQRIWLGQYGEQTIRKAAEKWGYEATQDRWLLEYLEADTMTKRLMLESRMKGGKQ